jgi:hypothetical protein
MIGRTFVLLLEAVADKANAIQDRAFRGIEEYVACHVL